MDKMFGVRFKNGKFLIGKKIIKIQGDNIVIGNELYVGTPGLWTSITEKNRKEYNKKDYKRYKEFLLENNVITDRQKRKKILHPSWKDFQHERIAPSHYEADNEEYFTARGDGLCRMYLEKNGRCFNILCVYNRIHLTTS